MRTRTSSRSGLYVLTALLCGSMLFLFAAALQARAETAESEGSAGELFEIPEYDEKKEEPFVEINDGEPFFCEADLTLLPEQYYGELDALGRVTGAYALLGKDLMPETQRSSITEIEPSGWQTISIDGGNLYQRCHLIAHQLTGQDIDRNLLTGTQYLNTEGMKRYEESVAQYVTGTGNRVMYRVTPIYHEDDLVASGVLMEGKSIEDDRICFCVYCFNVQPGIEIDYATGGATGRGIAAAAGESEAQELVPSSGIEDAETEAVRQAGTEYVLNTNSKKFHYPYCSSVGDMKQKNRKDYVGTREELIDQGYSPCKRCNP